MKLSHIFVLTALIASEQAFAASYNNDFNDGTFIYQYTDDSKAALLINPWPQNPNKDTYTSDANNLDYTHYTGTIVIPDKYKNLPVTGLNAFAFYNTAITSIDIPASVTTFGTSCLKSCDQLTSITIRGERSELNLDNFLVYNTGRLDTEIAVYSVNPPELSVKMDKINDYYSGKKLTIRVPAKSLNAYKADANWSQLNLATIEGETPVQVQYAIQDINMAELSKVSPVITADGEPFSADNMRWTSDNHDIVYPTADGSFFSHNPGTTTIHCLLGDQLLASATVNVTAKSQDPEPSFVQLSVENVYPGLSARFSMPLRQNASQTLNVNTSHGWTLTSATLDGQDVDITAADTQQSVNIPALSSDAALRLEYTKTVQTDIDTHEIQSAVTAVRNGSSLHLTGLMPGSTVRVYSPAGIIIDSATPYGSDATLTLSAEGPYIVTYTEPDGHRATLRLN